MEVLLGLELLEKVETVFYAGVELGKGGVEGGRGRGGVVVGIMR